MLKKIFALVLFLSLVGCQLKQDSENINSQSSNREVNQGLVLFNATLEQSNAEGQTLWKLSTEKAVYSQDNKTAKLTNIKGNLFSNKELILQVSAKSGEIKQDGEEVYLEKDIIAVDPRNKAEFKGNQLEWRPKQHTLVIRNNLTANHEKLTVSANEGFYQTEKQLVELRGNIVATAKKPPLQMKTEHLYWQIPQSKVIGDRPLHITRYEHKIITDELTTNQAEVNFNLNLVTAQGNIEYKSLKPPLQGATSVLFWQYKDRIIDSKQPIKLIQTQDNMTVTGNQANVNLATNMAYLSKGIYAEATKDEVKIYADDIAWDLVTKMIEAKGNVYYRQINPDFNLSGFKAVGKLKEKSIIVTGNNQNKVVTEIYPQEKK